MSRAGGPRERDARRRDEVFGDVLPDTTRDEAAEHTPEPDPDRWYDENRPPHHGRC